jgi:hypothetical protein
MNDLQAEIINDKTISESTLLLALQNLGTSSEPPSFWKKIINDASFKKFHRACCIFLLFQRHIHPGQRMSDLSSLIGNAEWITDDDIVLVHSIEGEIPVISISILQWCYCVYFQTLQEIAC